MSEIRTEEIKEEQKIVKEEQLDEVTGGWEGRVSPLNDNFKKKKTDSNENK